MNQARRQTRGVLRGLFQSRGLHPRADLGQNFLIDLNLIDCLVEQADLGPHDVVLEIGTGTGGLTAYLAERAAVVVSVEVDHRVHEMARAALSHLPNVILLNCDALHNKNRLSPQVLEATSAQLTAAFDRRLKFVANLPYCVATPVISNLVASDLPWQAMVVTIQWELAERFRAKPSSEHYGALSVWLQSQCEIEVLRKLGPAVFWPRPQVESAIVQILPAPGRRAQIGDRHSFHDFIRRLFQQRRKSLRSVLAGMYRGTLTREDIDQRLNFFAFKEGVRADELDVATLVALAGAMGPAQSGK